MSNCVVFIGGPPASGKTTLATRIASKFEIKHINLDDVHNLLEGCRLAESERHAKTKELCYWLLEILIDSGATCVCEGVWISADQANGLRKAHAAFHPFFCGYPNTSAKARFDLLRSGDKGYWQARNPIEETLTKLETEIGTSNNLKNECGRLCLPFIDMSDPLEGESELLNELSSILETVRGGT